MCLHAATASAASWRDSVFLSLDGFLSLPRDPFLGAVEHVGVLLHLEPDNCYTVEATFDVPPGTSGNLQIIVVTDRSSSNFEGGNVIDNQALGSLPPITLPPPTDLDVTSVTFSGATTGLLGTSVPIEWTIQNLGDDDVHGRWRDSVYLSVDTTLDASDVFLGRFQSVLTEPLPPQSVATFAGEIPLRAVTPGDYHVIVRADILNEMNDFNDDNNSEASTGTLAISAEVLALGVEEGSPLLARQERYFGTEIPEVTGNRALKITLDHDDVSAWTEGDVAFGMSAALLTTEKLLTFQIAAAEATRQAVLQNSTLLAAA